MSSKFPLTPVGFATPAHARCAFIVSVKLANNAGRDWPINESTPSGPTMSSIVYLYVYARLIRLPRTAVLLPGPVITGALSSTSPHLPVRMSGARRKLNGQDPATKIGRHSRCDKAAIELGSQHDELAYCGDRSAYSTTSSTGLYLLMPKLADAGSEARLIVHLLHGISRHKFL